MDKWLNKFERKCGNYAIHNFILILTIAMACVAFMDFSAAISGSPVNLSSYLYFDRDLIMQGQIWRLISFIILPPDVSIIFLIFALYLFYIFGKSLEDHWGSFKLNVYYLIGMLGTILGGFIAGATTNIYLSLSIFLAFAVLFPDYKIMLFFVLPVKVKYLAYIDAAFFVFSLFFYPLEIKLACAFSIANFLIFFGPQLFKRQKQKQSYKSVQKNFKNEMKKHRQNR